MKCKECGKNIIKKNWIQTEVGCEDCGDHPAVRCPNCESTFDIIFDEEYRDLLG